LIFSDPANDMTADEIAAGAISFKAKLLLKTTAEV
jgi:hypothetical protein